MVLGLPHFKKALYPISLKSSLPNLMTGYRPACEIVTRCILASSRHWELKMVPFGKPNQHGVLQTPDSHICKLSSYCPMWL